MSGYHDKDNMYFPYNDKVIITNTANDCHNVTQATFMAEPVRVIMMRLEYTMTPFTVLNFQDSTYTEYVQLCVQL